MKDREAVAWERGYRSLPVNQPTDEAAYMSVTKANGPDLSAKDVPFIGLSRQNPARVAFATALQAGDYAALFCSGDIRSTAGTPGFLT